MPISKLLTIGVALVTLGIVGVIGVLALQPPGDLIADAGFSQATISPDADGVDDVTTFSYTLSRNAQVSLVFVGEDNRTFIFRDNERRARGDYKVDFSGVVNGFVLEGETFPEMSIERRLLPAGTYTWTLTARDEDGESQSISGSLRIEDVDAQLPLLSFFEVSSAVFTPNQDGVRDRVRVNIYLEKPAELQVFLQDQDGVRRYLSERLLGRAEGEAGNHEYDYDGDVDNGFEPPPDGAYTLFAVAQDAEGQRVVRSTTLRIQDGGLPQVEIAAQPIGASVCFSTRPWDDRYFTDTTTLGDLIEKPDTGGCGDNTTITMKQGDLLVFYLAIYNYGKTPVRTQGPFPGTVYEFDQLANTLGYLERDGTFRIGINCNTTLSDHPWRWAIGAPDQLVEQVDPELNDTFYYLMPEGRAEVWGAIRITRIFEERNPMICSASLIHEGVRIDEFQQGIGRREIRLVPPSQSDLGE